MRSAIQIAAVVAAGLYSLSAAAGVTIENGPAYAATGTMNTAASVGAENAYIYCDYSASQMACAAADGLGNYAYCWTADPKQKRRFAAVGKIATLRFFTDQQTGQCARIDIWNGITGTTGGPLPGALKYQYASVVEPAYNYAYGTVSQQPTPGTNEGISCTANEFSVGCTATNKDGVARTCTSYADSSYQTLEDMTLAVNGVNESSYIYFTWDDAQLAHCTQIYVANASFYLP